MITTVDTRTDEPATGKPALGQTSAIVTYGHLAWVGWIWLVAAVIYVVVIVCVATWGEIDGSLWQSVFAGWQRWILFAAGITTTTTFLRMLVRNGVTRTMFWSASLVAMAVLTAICSAVITTGWAAEKLIYEGQGWSQVMNSEAVFAWSDVWTAAIETPIVLATFFLSGWLVGAGFYRYGVAGGLVLLLPCLVPAALTELVTSKDFGGVDIDVMPDVLSPPLLVAAFGGLALVAVTAEVARRVTLSTPLN